MSVGRARPPGPDREEKGSDGVLIHEQSGRWLSRAVLGRLSRPRAEPPHDRLPADRRDPDLDRRSHARRSHQRERGWTRLHAGRGHRRTALRRTAPDDPVPPEVPALVVRLEPRAAEVHEPGRRLPRLDGRHVPLHRRAPVRRPRPPLLGRARGAEPLAAAGEVAAGHPPLRDRGVVRDPLHRPLPAGPLRLRRGRPPLDEPGRCLRLHPRHGRIPAVQAGGLTADRRAMRRRPIGQILVEKGEISEVDLEAALAEQERTGRRLGEILIEQGRTSWLALARAIAEQVLDIQSSEDEPEPVRPASPDPVAMVRDLAERVANLPPVPDPLPPPQLAPPPPAEDPELELARAVAEQVANLDSPPAAEERHL